MCSVLSIVSKFNQPRPPVLNYTVWPNEDNSAQGILSKYSTAKENKFNECSAEGSLCLMSVRSSRGEKQESSVFAAGDMESGQ